MMANVTEPDKTACRNIKNPTVFTNIHRPMVDMTDLNADLNFIDTETHTVKKKYFLQSLETEFVKNI